MTINGSSLPPALDALVPMSCKLLRSDDRGSGPVEGPTGHSELSVGLDANVPLSGTSLPLVWPVDTLPSHMPDWILPAALVAVLFWIFYLKLKL